MSVIGSNILAGASGQAVGGYQVERSLRFNSSDSAYLSRTPSTAGNRKTWTWAGWVKRSGFGTAQVLFSATDGTTPFTIYLDTDNTLFIGNPSFAWKVTAQVFRDPGAWGHLLVAVDTTQASNANRAKIYWNGTQVSLTTDRDLYSNTDLSINGAFAHNIGRSASSSSQYVSGYLADVIFVDGQALDPTSFTEVSATTGQLIPKAYTGTFGTNGFWLKFSDNSNNTATTLGKDYSGNSNNWTPNNLSVTAGAGNDSLVDTPTSYGTDDGLGGSVRGNYCTWNPTDIANGLILANGNLDSTGTSTAWRSCRGTVGVNSGKWYWEVTAGGASQQIGIFRASTTLNADPGLDVNAYVYNGLGGKNNNNNYTAYGASYGAGDVVGVALDLDGGTIAFYKNGISQGTAYTGLSGTFCPLVAQQTTTTNSANFGQRPFAYTAPSGFKALCDTNLPAPVVAKPNTVMDVLTWTGNGANGRSITGLNFSPDFVWIKNRLNLSENSLFDTVRGAAKTLYSNQTAAELASSDFGHISSFDSAGFTLANGASGLYPNLATNWNGSPIVGWCFDAGSNTVSNTQGSISSQVRANASAGFSIVTYTGNGTTATVGHGLGVAPYLMIHKARNLADFWLVYHGSLGASTQLNLSSTSAAVTGSTKWNSTAPSSTVFTVTNDGSIGQSGINYVTYCFAPVAGYSSFGSYTGNGSTDGPFVYTGFRPRWVMVKSTGSDDRWTIQDTSRSSYNASTDTLAPNLSSAELANAFNLDINSNGFKVRSTNSGHNTSSVTYIYAAFAESPFQFSRAR